MRNLLLGIVALGAMGGNALQAQITQLTITVDATAFPNQNCALGGGTGISNKLYVHSGLCTSGQAFCRDSIRAYQSPVWQHVVGNWGADDGLGQLSHQGSDVYSIMIPIETYYANNTGGTPMPQGAVPYSIGMVFRNADGTLEGKDEACGDIFIVDIQEPQPLVRSGSGNLNVPNITVSKTVVGIEDVAFVGGMQVGPNPSKDMFNILLMMRQSTSNFRAVVSNSLGQTVAVLKEGKVQQGRLDLTWDGQNQPAGLYYLTVSEGGKLIAQEKLVVAR